jgi:hypothetical protein
MKNKTYFFGWTNIKWLLRQLLATFSDEPSYITSKRLERFGMYSSSMFVFLDYYRRNRTHISVGECIAMVTLMLGYAGYNSYQMRKEKQESSGTTTTVDNSAQDITKVKTTVENGAK